MLSKEERTVSPLHTGPSSPTAYASHGAESAWRAQLLHRTASFGQFMFGSLLLGGTTPKQRPSTCCRSDRHLSEVCGGNKLGTLEDQDRSLPSLTSHVHGFESSGGEWEGETLSTIVHEVSLWKVLCFTLGQGPGSYFIGFARNDATGNATVYPRGQYA